MAIPFLPFGEERIKARRGLRPSEIALADHQHISFLTNLGLGIALVIGFAVIFTHGGVVTAAIAAYGAALGCGGVLGFLFGVPSAARAPVTINNARSVAVGTGNDSKTTGGAVTAVSTATPPSVAPLTAGPNGNNDATAANPVPNAPTSPNAATAIEGSKTSNLEQVADWVTKLLLGGGLTQMQRIPPMVWRWSQIVAWGILRDDANPSPQRMLAEQSFSAGLLVYGFLLGFFSGYLITKLQLGKAIAE